MKDTERKDALPCSGHGDGCPCTEKIEREKYDKKGNVRENAAERL